MTRCYHIIDDSPFCWIIAVGNPLRGDDGAGSFVARRLEKKIGQVFGVRIVALPQLDVTLLDDVKDTDHLIFVDAAIFPMDKGVQWSLVISEDNALLNTHHLTPGLFMAFLDQIYGRRPAAWTVSIQGHDFSFRTELSPKTHVNALKAVRQIIFWIFTISIALANQKLATEGEKNG